MLKTSAVDALCTGGPQFLLVSYSQVLQSVGPKTKQNRKIGFNGIFVYFKQEFYFSDENRLRLFVSSHFMYTLIDKMCLIIKTNLLKSHALFSSDQVAQRSISQTF